MNNIPNTMHLDGASTLDASRTLRRGRFLLLSLLLLGAASAGAQTVSHPTAEITVTAKHYTYVHMLTATEKKDIEYIIVRASNGDVKTVFNACDVCYLADKGYSQSGGDLRCNNCGNRFAIDTLGGRNTAGTCHPGYLPHRIEGDQVVIDVADLIVGAYYFRTQSVTGIGGPAEEIPGTVSLRQNRRELIITLPADAQREFHIFAMNGQLRGTFTDASRIVRIPLAGMVPGAYVLAIVEGKALSTNVFVVD
jgi:hypothetical protein